MKELTDVDFEDFIKSKKAVIVDFWAPWCGPCRVSTPIFEELSKEFGEKLEFVKMNVDESPETSSKYSIVSIPTFIIFKDGEIAGEIHGSMPKPMFKQQIEENL
ncbi:MAG TPA: thioredoxin [archaeon]|nr:thioredoxin [archaeon]